MEWFIIRGVQLAFIATKDAEVVVYKASQAKFEGFEIKSAMVEVKVIKLTIGFLCKFSSENLI